ncbi:MAG: hypothetical protein GWO07_05610 [Candidatus Dadabacteria bacterium]|nr:hypothetical protein [Candidatus Dadabacteria bacterium]NIS08231.1 hypothetical protein [Candidatus Dadabacteria bacterium]NIV41498.1 hypothetical protein [Candidatus Dadabacteria bacterium]NIY21719.1 hypothetical protein [Candidatus Dadabacteria bacterium]
MLGNFRNRLYKCFSITLISTLLLLTVSGFSKSYIPVVTKYSQAALVEGCHEQVNHSVLKKLVQNVFVPAEDEDCCETICFCSSKNIRRSLKFTLVKSGFACQGIEAVFSSNTDKLILINNTLGVFGNKSPPSVLS